MATARSSTLFPDDDPHDDQFAHFDQMVRGSLSTSPNPVDALLASPFGSTTDTTISRYLTPWYFWRTMFADKASGHSKVFSDIFHGKHSGHKIIAMVGFRGSGKSTFIRWLSKAAKCPLLVLDFVRVPVFRLENEAISELPERTILRGVVGPEILRLLRWDRDENQWRATKAIRSIWCTPDVEAELASYEEKPELGHFKNALWGLDSWAENDPDEKHLSDLLRSIVSLPLELALLYIILMLLHYDALYEMPACIVDGKSVPRQVFVAFDNLDRLIEDSLDEYNHEKLTTVLFKAILNAFAATLLLVHTFAGLWENDQLDSRWSRTRFILTERRTTWQMTKTDHAERINRMTAVVNDFGDPPEGEDNNEDLITTQVTTVFPLKEVIKKRNEYLMDDIVTKECDTAKLAAFLEQILADRVLHLRLRPLFNFNIRAAIEKIGETDLTNQDRQAIQDLLENTNTASFGDRGILTLARGWVIGSTSKSFVQRGYLSNALSTHLTGTDETGQYYSANSGRLLLTYLHGRTKGAAREADPPIERSVTGSELLEAFSGFFKAEELATLLWQLYCRRTDRSRDRWSRLVEFVGDWGLGQTHLNKGIACAPEKVGVRITYAGITYLEFLSTHFELMNAQETKRSAWRPLYSLVDADDWAARVTSELDPVVERAEKCCRELVVFNEHCLVVPRFHGDWSKFRNSGHTLRVKNPFSEQENHNQRTLIAMTHQERLVFSHLTYLDSVRMAMTRNYDRMSDEGAAVNQTFLKYEQRYLRMLGENGQGDGAFNPLIEDLQACIRHVISSNYRDCRTPVNASVGEILLRYSTRHGAHTSRIAAAASVKTSAIAENDDALMNWIIDFENGHLG